MSLMFINMSLQSVNMTFYRFITLHKKISFQLRICSVNESKSAVSFTGETLNEKLHFLCSIKFLGFYVIFWCNIQIYHNMKQPLGGVPRMSALQPANAIKAEFLTNSFQGFCLLFRIANLRNNSFLLKGQAHIHDMHKNYLSENLFPI